MRTSIRTLHGVLALAICTGFATVADAGPEAVLLTRCHSIVDSLERLACYDRASDRSESEPDTTVTAGRLALQDPAEPGEATPDTDNAPTYEEVTTTSMIDAAWAFDPDSSRRLITMHQRNYLLFGRYTSHLNENPYSPLFDEFGDNSHFDPVEAKFQISFKTRLWTTESRRLGFWLAYTQQSHWQVYNDDYSRPFRENNFLPEVLFSYRPGISFAGFDWNLLNVGYAHQSNGRSDLLSRSWDRLFAEVGVERGNLGLFARVWYRIPENNDDENPDITDYYGYGALTALYRWNNHGLTLQARANPSTGKGAVEFSWVTPPIAGSLRGYLQLFSGYGETLIDYNWYQNTVGIGVTLNDLY